MYYNLPNIFRMQQKQVACVHVSRLRRVLYDVLSPRHNTRFMLPGCILLTI
jgi:hypothetical protein